MESEETFLKNYDSSDYEKPSVTVDMLVYTVMNECNQNYRKLPKKKLKLLLIKRKNHPFKDQWAIPGGFVEIDESLDDAAKRELKEETNIDNIYMEQLYTYGDVDRDPRTRVISCAYMALVDHKMLNVKADDDAEDAKWFEIHYQQINENKKMESKGYVLEKIFQLTLINDDTKLESKIQLTIDVNERNRSIKREIISSNKIAFDHALAISYGVERLRNKIEYTDIAFNLMSEEFTLTELQQVYEVILGRSLLKANFRRKITDMVIETNDYTKDKGHRPSKLYTFNPHWMDTHFERRN